MNVITVAGKLGRDSELRATPNGDSILSFSVADSQGKDKPTIWWNCQLWGYRGEALQQYLTKGTSVTVSGTVSERTYNDKTTGAEKKAVEVKVNEVALQGGRSQESAPKAAPKPSAPANRGSFADMDSDDIPFNDPMKSRAFCLAC